MPQVLGTDAEEGISGMGTKVSGARIGPIGMLTNVALDGQTVTDIDVTTMNDLDNWMNFIAGLKDAKTLTLALIYGASNTATLMAELGEQKDLWTIHIPDGATIVVSGYISSLGQTFPINDKVGQQVTIRLAGKPVYHAPS